MSFTKSLERGITSATYNAEAEKALREERKQASEARQKFRDALFGIRDKKTELVSQKKATDYYIISVDKTVNDAFAWLTANPEADTVAITDRAQAVSESIQQIQKTNVIVLRLTVFSTFLKTISADLLLKKQIKEEKKNEIDTFADKLAEWIKTTPTLTADQIQSKEQSVELEAKGILQGTGESVPAVKTPEDAAKAQKAVAAKEVQVKKEEEADRATFSAGRLIKESLSIAVKVIGSLFIVMLFMVSGMLTANDAIARDPMYRIFYFMYGGLGFPFMLLYYLYKWFAGSAPHIYKLLPLYTKPADTSIGRFFLFPFTYVEDQAAKDATTKFMTDAAKLVGKEYKPPAEAAAEKLGKLIEGIQGLALNAGSTAAKGTNAILKGLKELNVTK